MKKLRNNKIRKLLAFMVALALMVSCMPSAYTISASEAFGDGTEDIFTDGEITSEPAAEESTPDVSSADQEETEQAQQSTLTYENDSVKVTAEALEDGALPQNTALKADSVNENSSVSYDTVSQKLSAAATDKGSSLRGFFAYDVYFADGDGNRVEPNGRVRVTFEYKTPAAENPEVTPDAEPSEAPAENPDAEPTEAPAEDIASPEEVPAADENGETSLIEVLGDDTNLRVSPSIEAEVLATVNAGTQLTLLDTVTAEDGATWYKVSWEGTEAYIRSDMAQVVDSNDEAEEPEDVQEEEIQPEITRYDYKSDEVNVKVTLTDPADLPDNAELSVTPVELSQEAEDQITEEAIKEKKAIEKIHSYDIKFLVDGEEVQPGASVKVSVSLNDEKKIKDADVYHVDAEDNVENMDGSVDKNGNVEFETTHFSTYVIVQRGGENVKVIIRHLDNTTSKEIYSADERTILVGGKINDYTKAKNWEVSKVKVNGAEVNKDKKIEVAQDSTIEVYYTPKHNANFQGPTSFYDYTVKAGESYDENTRKQTYYSFNMLGDAAGGEKGNQKITSGKMAHNYDSYKYNFTVNSGYDVNENKIEAEVNNYKEEVKRTEGLLKEVEDNGKGAVKFNYPEPGFFVDQDAIAEINGTKTYLRRVIKDYKLVFDQNGDSYKLTKVIDKNGDQRATAGNNFFPLDGVPRSEKSDDGNHNYFFGMRYDVTFKIGDYVGPLNYTFSGDDDLWVVLDGKHIVIDLGGIHQAAKKTVNLKPYVEGEDKEKEHTLTILYMERGAYESNCQMEFTLPSARISEVTNVPTTDLVLKKVNKSQDALSGARFTLVNSETHESQTATSVDETGLVNFTSLRPGTYTLTEDLAPNGYEASNESWIVKVTLSEDNKAVATLYKADGKTEIEKNTDSLYHIMNYTQEEIIKASMDYSKTATVNDWDKRTYDINITAASTSTSTITTTEKAVADIMLVLDVSGSMDDKTVSYSYVAENTTDGRAGLNTGTLYYVKKDESYVKLQYYNNYYGRTGWYIGDDWRSQTKADDSTYNGCKIYLKKTEKKLTALQNAVKQFITDTANKSPDSKIGITAFSSAGYGSHGKTEDLQKAGDNKENLTRFVDSLVANGGTDPYVGLKNAKSKLDAATMSGDTKPKYVLLFTDGEPTGSGNSWDTTAQQNAENITNGTESIKGIKQEGYTVYTIGFGLRDKAKAFLEGGTYGWTTYPGIASKNCAFNAGNATQLGDIFKDIQNTITQDISITGATITDIIDPRFELLKDDGTLYTQDDLNNGVEVNGGTVSLVKGNYQIQWTNQTIPNKKKNGEWNKTIKVKAKDNFVGGNNVTTNVSPDSKISTGYGDVELPQPTVNVKVNLVVKDKDVWIYKGDTVPTDEAILNQLFNESETSYSKGTISAADAKDHITLQWKDGTQTNISKENMATTPDDDTEYYLEVTYDPKTTSTDESKTNTKQHVVGAAEKAYNPDNSNNPYGIYKIHVIKGQIQITKNVTEKSDTDRTFTFYVKDKDGKDISGGPITVKVEKNQKRGTAIVEKLSRGTYTVTEADAPGYTIKAFDIGTETDCESPKSDASSETKSLTFVLGNDTDGNDVIHVSEDKKNYTYDPNFGGVKGVASYTNEAVTSLDLKKTDIDNHSLTGAKFKLEMKDGNSWKSLENDIEVKNGTSEIELNDLKAGIYKLTETTAPKGYSLLGSSIYFKVATGNVTLVDENGDLAQDSNMWSLENKVLTIKNAKLYSLPESGGPGTYGFTISGVAILATALLLFINNKRREEEAKRS